MEKKPSNVGNAVSHAVMALGLALFGGEDEDATAEGEDAEGSSRSSSYSGSYLPPRKRALRSSASASSTENGSCCNGKRNGAGKRAAVPVVQRAKWKR